MLENNPNPWAWVCSDCNQELDQSDKCSHPDKCPNKKMNESIETLKEESKNEEEGIVICSLHSKTLAQKICRIIAKMPGNGGLKFFRITRIKLESKNDQSKEYKQFYEKVRRLYQIIFLSEIYRKEFPDKELPNVNFWSGWVRGYCYYKKKE